MSFPLSRRFPVSFLFARRTARVRQACILACCMSIYGSAQALDVNQATADQLEALRGLGTKTAALIVKERARGGPYESMDNLAERVKGLGAKKARALEAAGLRAGPASPQSAGARPAAATTGPTVSPNTSPNVRPAASTNARPTAAPAPPRSRRPIQAPAAIPAPRHRG